MKIFDISQEVFDCNVFEGDPQPQRIVAQKIAAGDLCNLTEFHMCAHNGTHVDAPFHFYDNGRTIDKVDLEKFIGYSYVAKKDGTVTAEDARNILKKAETEDPEAAKRILIKGKAVVSYEAAEVFAESGICLLGNESQTVGPEDAPKDVHLKLLEKEIVLLEGIRLENVPEGVYFLNAAPLNLGGADGAPCRAVLIDFDAYGEDCNDA